MFTSPGCKTTSWRFTPSTCSTELVTIPHSPCSFNQSDQYLFLIVSESSESPDSNIYIPISYSVHDTTISLLIEIHFATATCWLQNCTWKEELNSIQMSGMSLVSPGCTWSSTYLIRTVVLVWLLMILLRMLFRKVFYDVTTSRFVSWLGVISQERESTFWLIQVLRSD